MRVFVAGATGAVGRPLVHELHAAGHQVTGTTRSPEKAERLREAGADPVVLDALDAAALRGAVVDASPEVVVNQLTDLPPSFDPRKIDYGPTNRLRSEAGRTLADAAVESGAKRLISQSLAFLYAPEGEAVKDEDAAPFIGAPEPFGSSMETVLDLERRTIDTEGIEGVVLRYGFFYGPGTWYASDGATADEVRRRRYPIVGNGAGVFSFIHVDDAAAATVAAIDRGAPGIYNVVDDDPATLREWLPEYAEALGAKPPRRVPKLIARLIAGPFAASMSTELRGASSEKAKRELGWRPAYESWRRGFRQGLG